MKLCDVTKKLNIIKISGNEDVAVNRICTDNRIVSPGDCFVCIKGFVRDGHEFAESAVKNGASAVVVQDEKYFNELSLKYSEHCFILTDDTRYALALLSDNLSEHPSGDLMLLGITGTKG